ncbi:hypothetical protein VE01_00404 [Pseudogymnoascus verrucosus]|uniref:Heterokaryon incompatibility domain-containing protein n=1 Tax=Pseudogymnoascus verrucosus TaxID=342668 RepID=A0A2P2SX21_9PEZI|nr:uncharacterized protein VE01_00404 [Pseudogymnoascus verrucosus]OBU01409.1 hypothetical protein VE01_00404 [Pseudogymnoascus verrucosus]
MAALYRALGLGRREIRLLKLLKSDSFDSPIRGRLVHTTLDDHEPYETISYVWGVPKFTQTIELESQPFGVTPHLENGLRHLRLASKDRTIWVDAVCINQSDDVERGEQVMLMKQIYESCTGNLVWLHPMVPTPSNVSEGENQGEEVDEEKRQQQMAKTLATMEEGLDLFSSIYTRDIKSLEPMRHKRGEVSFWETTSDKPGDDVWLLEYEQMDSLQTLFTYSLLWSRIWVMQELACAPRITLVIGKRTLDWDMLDSFLGDAEYSDAFHMEWGHGTVGPMAGQTFSKVKTIQNQRTMTQAGQRSSLMDVLARFKGSRSTDPRDKIYGLLGLTSQSREMKVDYRKSVAEVFTEATTNEINGSENLDIITQNPFQGNDSTERLAGLPSWVPDFSCNMYDDYSNQYSSILFAQRGIYSAGSAECKVPCDDVLPGRVLRLHGTVIGRVGPILFNDWEQSYDVKPGWQLQNLYAYKKLYLSPDVLDSSATYVNGEPELQAFWRTLAGDCVAYPIERLDQTQIAEDGKAIRELMRQPLTEESRWYTFYKDLASGRMMDKMFMRWMFTKADNGLFLMVKEGAKEGDVIVVVDGGKVPLLLRKVEDGEGGGYTVVNAAYVHGFMDGEARTWVEEGKLTEQDFLVV